jgi:Phosphoesterase family
VVIFQENVSFDHYFGTYPKAQNLAGETPFVAKKDTPTVNNLVAPLDVNNHFAPLSGLDLIHDNPNNDQTAPNNGKQNAGGASNPFRLAPSQALTADQRADRQTRAIEIDPRRLGDKGDRNLRTVQPDAERTLRRTGLFAGKLQSVGRELNARQDQGLRLQGGVVEGERARRVRQIDRKDRRQRRECSEQPQHGDQDEALLGCACNAATELFCHS